MIKSNYFVNYIGRIIKVELLMEKQIKKNLLFENNFVGQPKFPLILSVLLFNEIVKLKSSLVGMEIPLFLRSK